MKPTLINHPLRLIKLGYKSDKPLSLFEEQAILEYQQMHTLLDEQLKQQAVLEPQLKPLASIIYNCECQLEMYEILLLKCGMLAGFTKEQQDRANEELKYATDSDEIFREAREAQGRLEELNNVLMPLDASYRQWNEKNIALCEMVYHFEKTYLDVMIANDEEMEISSSCLHGDIQNFYFILDKIDRRNVLMEAYGKFADRYNSYTSRLDAAYKHTELLRQSAMEIEAIQKNKGFGLN